MILSSDSVLQGLGREGKRCFVPEGVRFVLDEVVRAVFESVRSHFVEERQGQNGFCTY